MEGQTKPPTSALVQNLSPSTSTIPVLSVRSFSVLGRSGVERVGTVWLTSALVKI